MISKPYSKKLITLIIVTLLSISVKAQQCPDNNRCENCIDSNCKVCSSNTTICETCIDRFFLESTACIECPTNCLSCTNLQQCDECIPGYDTTFDENGNQACVFYWWKWFLIIFGTILGLVLIILLIYFIRKKLKEEDTKNKQIEYQMKLQNTEPNIS